MPEALARRKCDEISVGLDVVRQAEYKLDIRASLGRFLQDANISLIRGERLPHLVDSESLTEALGLVALAEVPVPPLQLQDAFSQAAGSRAHSLQSQ